MEEDIQGMKHRIMIESLDEKARSNGFSNWHKMKQSLAPGQARFIEDVVRDVLSKINFQSNLNQFNAPIPN